MARQRRHTEPLDTVDGVLTDYAEIERHLIAGELSGRTWVFEQAGADRPSLYVPTDDDIRTMHRAMFGALLPWAGRCRTIACGPGGKVPVDWWNVPAELRNFTADLQFWVNALLKDPNLEQLAAVVADAHHRFQWIHPFQDTNGRTGRVLDAYLLWVTFGLVGASVETSPIIEPFPTESDEDEYYEGLNEADSCAPERLRSYYTRRILAALDS